MSDLWIMGCLVLVCDWWVCSCYNDCKAQCYYTGAKYPPCACCVRFDKCSVCANYVDCADIVTKYLPNMFRRLVREIRLGEDTQKTEQYIKRNTLGGRNRK